MILVVGYTWSNAILVNLSSEVDVETVAIVVHNEKCTWQGQRLCNHVRVPWKTVVSGRERGNYNSVPDSNAWTMYIVRQD